MPEEHRTPDYITKALAKNKSAKPAYDKLSPSHQREYIKWITEAKKEETREKRVSKMIEMLTKKNS